MRLGFSLVELSIVLVILGLLTGGILAGQSLIRGAELRSISSDLSRYQSAIHTFRDKYSALPGDMNNATAFWGAQHATAATCRTTASTSALTCNGDGNGQISTMDSGVTHSEFFRSWQHLANAGLIEGSYSGVGGAGGVTDSDIGINVPAGRISRTGFSLSHIGVQSAAPDWYDGNYPNMLNFGGEPTTWQTSMPAISPDEAWGLDTKLDDGKPAYGSVVAFKSTSARTPNCTTTAVISTAEYNLTNSARLCSIAPKVGL